MKKYCWLKIIGPITYAIAIILGGLLISNYNPINQAISEIQPLLDINKRIYITLLYSCFFISMSIYGLIFFPLNKKRSVKIHNLSLFILGLSGLLLHFFQPNIEGDATTVSAIMHIIIALIMALMTIISTLTSYLSFNNKTMKIYSLITGILLTIFIFFSTYNAALKLNYVGLFERITVGAFILWSIITGIYQLKAKGDIYES